MKSERVFVKLTIGICITVLSFSLNSQAQSNDFVKIAGVWESEETSVNLEFGFSEQGEVKLDITDTITGEKMKIWKLYRQGDTVFTREEFVSNQWVTYNKYYLSANDSLVNIIMGEEETALAFRRKH